MAHDEEVDVIDDEDRVVGAASIGRCLREGLLHRAIAVLVKRNSGAIVLQQRSRNDSWHPGMWTISCTGHVRKGESYRDAAIRELGEELRLSSRVEEFRKFLLPRMSSNGLIEFEWIMLFTTLTDAPITIDAVELESAVEVKQPELKKVLTDWPLTPDARILLGEYMKSSSLSK
ncbi:MAG TPA: NUDIX domain-containing protein [Nitrososphaerales archaeon]|nr:NUDIX domain-containing protein [Nitrososphaerales archaeon]